MAFHILFWGWFLVMHATLHMVFMHTISVLQTMFVVITCSSQWITRIAVLMVFV